MEGGSASSDDEPMASRESSTNSIAESGRAGSATADGAERRSRQPRTAKRSREKRGDSRTRSSSARRHRTRTRNKETSRSRNRTRASEARSRRRRNASTSATSPSRGSRGGQGPHGVKHGSTGGSDAAPIPDLACSALGAESKDSSHECSRPTEAEVDLDERQRKILGSTLALAFNGELRETEEFGAQLACGFVPRENALRRRLNALVNSYWFDKFIVLCIIVNSGFLASWRPLDANDSERNQLLDRVEIVFQVIFTVEMACKIAAKGFFKGRGTYLGNPWNVMDFVVVLLGWLPYVAGDLLGDNLSAVRIVRVLRPLRALTNIPGLLTLINALFSAVKQLGNIMVLCVFIFAVFGILGVQLFRGKFRQRCAFFDGNATVLTDQLCAMSGGDFPCPENHFCVTNGTNPNEGVTGFDDIFQAFLTIFQCITLEGWTEVMYYAESTTSRWSNLFFLFIVLIGSFFVLNLVLAVVVVAYASEEVEQAKRDLANVEKGIQSASKEALRHQRFKQVLDMKHDLVLRYESGQQSAITYEEYCAWKEELRDYGHEGAHLGTDDEEMSHFEYYRNLSDLVAHDAMVDRARDLIERATRYMDDSRPDKAVKAMREANKLMRAAQRAIERARAKMNQGKDPGSAVDDLVGPYAPVRTAPWWKLISYRIVSNRYFQAFVTALIVVNTVALCIEYYDQPQYLSNALSLLNFGLTVLFAVEMVLKIAGLGMIGYTADSMNVFDGCIVLLSLAELLFLGDGSRGGAVTAMRAFRLLRIFKLARSWKSLNLVLRSMAVTLHSVVPFSIVLFLFLFIFTLCGMQLFGGTFLENGEVPRAHFNSLLWAFVTVFQVLTGEDWNAVMYEAVESTNWFAVLYFVVLVAVGNYLVLNLFLAILISRFTQEQEVAAEQQRKEELAKNFGLTLDHSDDDSHGADDADDANATPADDSSDDESSDGARDSDNAEAGEEKAEAKAEAPKPHPAVRETGADESLAGPGAGRDSPGGACEEAADGADPPPPALTRKRSVRFADESGRALHIELGAGAHPAPPLHHAEDEPAGSAEGKGKGAEMNGIGGVPRGTASEGSQGVGAPVVETLPPRPRRRTQTSKAAAGHQGRDPVLVHPAMQFTALGIFEPGAEFRVSIARLVMSTKFDMFILVAILLNCILLALSEPAASQGRKDFIRSADSYFTYIFIAEFGLKIIAFGFALHPGAYLRDPWNWVDALVVFTSILDLFLNDPSLKGLNALRVMRALRPLRVVRRLEGLQIVLRSILLSLPLCFNVVIVASLFYVVFAILGVNFFSGRFYSCTDPSRTCFPDAPGIQDCPPELACVGTFTTASGANETRRWVNPNFGGGSEYSFDSLGVAILTLFECSTLELYLEVLYRASDITGVGTAPVRDSNEGASLFFVIFTIFASFFVLNIFVSVVVENFNNMSKQPLSGGAFMTVEQKQWLTVQKAIAKQQARVKPQPPAAPWRAFLFRLVEDERSEVFIMSCIGVNVLVMATLHYEQSGGWTAFQDAANLLFAAIFCVEMLCKFAAYGVRSYFKSPWNAFDFVCVMASVVSFLLDTLSSGSSVDLSLLRIFRVARILRLIRKSERLRTLFLTLFYSFPSLINVGSLMGMLFFVYAVAGMTLFGDLPNGEFITDHANFRTFYTSFITLFRMTTGESWNGIMHEAMIPPDNPDCTDSSCYTYIPVPFFVSFMIVGQYVMLNLFIAVILENFEREMGGEEGAADTSAGIQPRHISHFNSVWSSLQEALGANDASLMPVSELQRLIVSLDPPLGLKRAVWRSEGRRNADIFRRIRLLRLPVTAAGQVHFQLTLRAMAKLTFGQSDAVAATGESPALAEVVSEATTAMTEYTADELLAARAIQRLYRNHVGTQAMGDTPGPNALPMEPGKKVSLLGSSALKEPDPRRSMPLLRAAAGASNSILRKFGGRKKKDVEGAAADKETGQ